MKIQLIISLLVLCLNAFAQKSKKDSSINPIIPNHATVKAKDSIALKTVDSFLISQTPQGNSIIKVLLTKQDDASDGWFVKYVYPVVLLLIGVMIPLVIESLNDKKRIRKVGERWTAELRFLENPIKSQIKEIEEYLLIHNQQNLVFPDFQIIEGLDCGILGSLDKSELLKFLEENKTSNYKKAVDQSNYINAYVSIVKGSNTNLILKFKEYSDGVSSYIMKVTENLTALSRAFGTYGVLLEQELKADPINDPRFIAIQNLFDAEIEPFRQVGNYELYRLHDNFLMPFLHVLSQLRHDFRTNEMAKYVGKCIDAIKGVKMEKSYMKTNFETIVLRYKENVGELPQVISIVERTKK